MSKYLTMIIIILLLILVVVVIVKATSKDTETKNVETATSAASTSPLSTPEETTATDTTPLPEPTTAEMAEEVKVDTEVSVATEPPIVATTPSEPVILPVSPKTMLIAGGCFWCVEADAEKLPGVIEAVSGYAEGSSENPTYKNYNKTGHREVVEVTYDENRVSFQEVIINAIKHMDPTDGDGSFNDRGQYYSPALYYDTAEQKKIIEATIARFDEHGPYDKPLAIEVIARPKFWPAEDYHQDYYKGTLSALKYKYYRSGSGRDAFIKKYWGDNTGPTLP